MVTLPMGGSWVQPENKMDDTNPKPTPHEKAITEQKSNPVRERRPSKRNSSNSSDYKGHSMKGESREGSLRSSQRRGRSGTRHDTSVPRNSSDYGGKGAERQRGSSKTDPRKENSRSKMDPPMNNDSKEHYKVTDNSNQITTQRLEAPSQNSVRSNSSELKNPTNNRESSREHVQQRTKQWKERNDSKTEYQKSWNDTNYGSKEEKREQMASDRRERQSSKRDLSKSRDINEPIREAERSRERIQSITHERRERSSTRAEIAQSKDGKSLPNKPENREFSQQWTSNRPDRRNSKMDLSKPNNITEHCNDAENRNENSGREIGQQWTSNGPDRRSSKMDLSKPKDFIEHCNKAEKRYENAGREFGQRRTSNRPDRRSSKMDLSKPNNTTEHCNDAENREFGQQRTSNWPDRRNSKMDLSKPNNITEHCNDAENRESSQITSEYREWPTSKMDVSGPHSLRSSSENRTSSQQSIQRYEMQSSKMKFCPIQDFNNSANKRERRESSHSLLNQREERHGSRVDFNISAECKDQDNMRQNWEMSPPMINQREERAAARVNFNISTECNDYGNKRQNRESSLSRTNQMHEKTSPKLELTIYQDGNNHCTSSMNRECSPNPANIQDPPSHFHYTMECSPQVMNQRRERPVRKEEFPSSSSEFKDYPSKRENREFTYLTGSSTGPETPFPRNDMSSPRDNRDRPMRSENRTEYKTGDRPFSNSKTFLPEQSSARLSTSPNMPAMLRTSFVNSQTQSRPSYDSLKKMNSTRNRAALTIQAHWRGYATRKKLRRQYGSTSHLQAASKGYKTQNNQSAEHKATSLIQSNYRSYQNRDDLRAQDLRAAQIQKEWREFLHRQQTEQNKSPLAVQTHYKDHRSTTELLVRIRAASIIQAWYRGYKTRKALKEQKQASIRLARNKKTFSFREPSGSSLRKSASQAMESPSKCAPKSSTVPAAMPEVSWMSAELKSDRGRNPPPKQQHAVGNKSEAVGQGSFSGEYSHSDWTKDLEKEDGCCQNLSVVQSMETQPRFKFEVMDNKISPKTGANSKPFMQSRPSIPPMAFSTQYHCRRTITPGSSLLLSQDRSRERAKSSCDIAWSENNKVLPPYRSDHKQSGHAYSPEPFRKRIARSYPNNQLSSTIVDRRKSLYEGKMIETYKYSQTKPPVPVYGPPIGWRKISYVHSSEPQFQQCFKGKERTAFCDRQNDQENISPSREEHQISVSLYNTDMCSRKATLDCALEETCCQPLEKTMSSFDSRANVHKPPTFSSNPDTCTRRVTCEKFCNMSQYRQGELNTSLLDNELDEEDHCFTSGTAHTSPEYSSSSVIKKADFGKSFEQSQGRVQDRTQNNNHNRQDALSQPVRGPTGLSPRKPSQQFLHKSLTEGISSSNFQSAWKGIQSRVTLKHQHDAATRIQAFYRGYKTRKYLQASGILNRNNDKARRKEPKAAGDGQRFSISSRLSPKRGNSSRYMQNYDSRFHTSRQSFRAHRGTIEKEVPPIRYCRSSFT